MTNHGTPVRRSTAIARLAAENLSSRTFQRGPLFRSDCHGPPEIAVSGFGGAPVDSIPAVLAGEAIAGDALRTLRADLRMRDGPKTDTERSEAERDVEVFHCFVCSMQSSSDPATTASHQIRGKRKGIDFQLRS